MIIETKFSLDDAVFYIRYSTKRIKKTCSACSGSGAILLGEEKFTCPKCYACGTVSEYLPKQWYVKDTPMIVGLVRPCIFKKDIYTQTRTKNEYMCHNTGIGSGSVYCEEDLFATTEEAQVECDKRNEEEQNAQKSD